MFACVGRCRCIRRVDKDDCVIGVLSFRFSSVLVLKVNIGLGIGLLRDSCGGVDVGVGSGLVLVDVTIVGGETVVGLVGVGCASVIEDDARVLPLGVWSIRRATGSSDPPLFGDAVVALVGDVTASRLGVDLGTRNRTALCRSTAPSSPTCSTISSPEFRLLPD